MVKETNRQSKVLEWWDDGFKTNKSGKKVYALTELPNMIEQFAYKATYKRLRMAEERIDKFVRQQANLLFLMIRNEAIGKVYNPYSDNRPWPLLSKSYNRKKELYGTQNKFWLYTGYLSRWLSRAKPSRIFGDPYVEVLLNKSARGYQWVTFQIQPFPNATYPNMDRESEIYYRLFGRHFDDYGIDGRMSNEEKRPIVAPAMRKLMDSRIKNGVKRILKEAIEND